MISGTFVGLLASPLAACMLCLHQSQAAHMTSQDQDDLIQSTIDANTLAARLWFQDVSILAQSGNEDAQALVELNKTEEGQRTLWTLITNINHAISSVAFDLPANDAASTVSLRAITKRHPQARWVIDQHRQDMPLEEVNPALAEDEAALAKANARLDVWFSL